MPYENQFAALSHPLRQQILNNLQFAPATVGELTNTLPASQPVISQHLKVLKNAGLISATPSGAKRIYKIEDQQLALLRDYLQGHWLGVLNTLGTEGQTDD